MKATLLKITEKPSLTGGVFYYAFFKDVNGKSWRSCLYPKCGNFSKWRRIVDKFLRDYQPIELDRLSPLRGSTTVIDADSDPVEIVREAAA